MECYVCHAQVGEAERFCPECGQPFPLSPAVDEVLADFDVASFTALRMTKEQLAEELERIIQEAGERKLTNEEKHGWSRLYEQWKEVADQITRQMHRFSERLDVDRREGPTRQQDRRREDIDIDFGSRRAGLDRRRAERRSRLDRRDPYGPPDLNGKQL